MRPKQFSAFICCAIVVIGSTTVSAQETKDLLNYPAFFYSGGKLDDDVARELDWLTFFPSLEVMADDDELLEFDRLPAALDKDIDQILKANSIRRLTFRSINPTAKQLERLQKLPKVREIWFTDLVDADKKLAAIAKFKSLEKLTIEETDMTDLSAEALGKMKNLKELTIDKCQVTAKVFAKHSLADSVTKLVIYSDQMDEGIFVHSRFPPEIKTLILVGDPHPDRTRYADLSLMRKFDKLEELKVSFFNAHQMGEIRQMIPHVLINGTKGSDLKSVEPVD